MAPSLAACFIVKNDVLLIKELTGSYKYIFHPSITLYLLKYQTLITSSHFDMETLHYVTYCLCWKIKLNTIQMSLAYKNECIILSAMFCER